MASIKHLVDLDLSKNQLLNAVVQNLATAPTTPSAGQIYWSTADDTLYVWNEADTVWMDLGSDGITNLAYTTGVSNGVVTSDTGTDATIPLADGTNAGLISAAEKSKLAGIEAGAQVNVAETVTSLALNTNTLTYTDENGTNTDIDLSLYLDDTNLARLTSGSINGSTGLATFTRDDATTFTIDMSAFLDGITVNNTLTSTSTTEGLSAAQGKVLKDLIDAINSDDIILTEDGNNSHELIFQSKAGGTSANTSEGHIYTYTEGDYNVGMIFGTQSKDDSGNEFVLPSFRINTTDSDTYFYNGIEVTDGVTITNGTSSQFLKADGSLDGTSYGTVNKYSALIGNGSLTTIVVTHNLGEQFVNASVYEVAGMDKVECEIELTSTNTTTFKFNSAPASNALRVVITG